MKKVLMSVAVLAVFCLILAGAAKADSFTAGDVFLTGTVTATTATLTIECLDSGCNGWFLGDVTLKGFTFTSLTGAFSAPAGYNAVAGGQDNNAVGNGGGCNSTQLTSAVCWDTQDVPLAFQLVTGVTYTFTAGLNGGSTAGGPLHIQATAYDNSGGSQKGGGKVFAISDDLLTTTTVPEPSSLMLLAVGLLGALTVVGRKLIAA